MSKYTTYYIERQQMYKDLATNWKKYADEHGITKRQMYGMSLFFKGIAKRFGLVKAFKEIGVI